MRVWPLPAALGRIAALLVAGVARHTALLPPCPAPQTNPHHPHTHTETALVLRVQTDGADSHRPAIGVVGWIGNPLIVQR